MSVEGEFFLSITGSIEHAEFYDVDNAYCKYGFHFGPEWSVVAVSYFILQSDGRYLRIAVAREYGFQQEFSAFHRPHSSDLWNFFRVSKRVWRKCVNAAVIHGTLLSGISL